jgi:hypothetical protein
MSVAPKHEATLFAFPGITWQPPFLTASVGLRVLNGGVFPGFIETGFNLTVCFGDSWCAMLERQSQEAGASRQEQENDRNVMLLTAAPAPDANLWIVF